MNNTYQFFDSFKKKKDLISIDQFLNLEKIRSENTDQFLNFIKNFVSHCRF